MAVFLNSGKCFLNFCIVQVKTNLYSEWDIVSSIWAWHINRYLKYLEYCIERTFYLPLPSLAKLDDFLFVCLYFCGSLCCSRYQYIFLNRIIFSVMREQYLTGKKAILNHMLFYYFQLKENYFYGDRPTIKGLQPFQIWAHHWFQVLELIR